MAVVAARYVLIPTKPDKSSRKGMVGMAELFTIARDRNPDLELLGVVLTGIESQATAIRAQVRDTVEDTLQGVAPVMSTIVRHGTSTSYAVREHGRLPHEIERVASTAKPWWQELRDRATGASDPQHRIVRLPRTETAAGVAQDYAALTREVIDAIADHEESDGGTSPEQGQPERQEQL